MHWLGRRWSSLHRLIYLIAILGVLHYFWHKAGKNDFQTVYIYAGIILVLLAVRIPVIREQLRRIKTRS